MRTQNDKISCQSAKLELAEVQSTNNEAVIRGLRMELVKAKSVHRNMSTALIFVGLVTVASLAFLFIPSSPLRTTSDARSNKNSKKKNVNEEAGFAASGAYFTDLYETIGPSSRQNSEWSSNSCDAYSDNIACLKKVIGSTATANQEVDTAIKTQAEQVDAGRRNLSHTLDGLQLAMPVSESLYYSDPAGQAVSYSFQLASANAAVGKSIDTTNRMHNYSQEHGERLTALAQQYDEALKTFSTKNLTAQAQ